MVFHPDDPRTGSPPSPIIATSLVAAAATAVLVAIIVVLRLASPLDLELAAEIEEAHDAGRADARPIRDFTDFAWDRVCLFGPDATQEEVDAALGFEWGRAAGDTSQMSDLLVFVEGEEVVRATQVRRGIVPGPPPGGTCRTPEEATTR